MKHFFTTVALTMAVVLTIAFSAAAFQGELDGKGNKDYSESYNFMVELYQEGAITQGYTLKDVQFTTKSGNVLKIPAGVEHKLTNRSIVFFTKDRVIVVKAENVDFYEIGL